MLSANYVIVSTLKKRKFFDRQKMNVFSWKVQFCLNLPEFSSLFDYFHILALPGLSLSGGGTPRIRNLFFGENFVRKGGVVPPLRTKSAKWYLKSSLSIHDKNYGKDDGLSQLVQKSQLWTWTRCPPVLYSHGWWKSQAQWWDLAPEPRSQSVRIGRVAFLCKRQLSSGLLWFSLVWFRLEFLLQALTSGD